MGGSIKRVCFAGFAYGRGGRCLLGQCRGPVVGWLLCRLKAICLCCCGLLCCSASPIVLGCCFAVVGRGGVLRLISHDGQLARVRGEWVRLVRCLWEVRTARLYLSDGSHAGHVARIDY